MASKNFRTTDKFFSVKKAEPTEEKSSAPNIPEGYKLVPTETKSKRLQLLITPSLQEKLRDLSKAEGLSINEIANRAFEAYIENYLNGGI